ncbi:hypothetical protein V5799_002624 [Amblyomma americanum]|uniref:Uncharacterized protein n=1 Tax=Amblyomma americanum TaxID=6943 RepID=A0AAQ4DBA4_AMBAM
MLVQQIKFPGIIGAFCAVNLVPLFLYLAVKNLACLVVSQIQYKVSLYHITLAGGILASIGITASAFAPNIIWMTVTFGVLYGKKNVCTVGIVFVGKAG